MNKTLIVALQLYTVDRAAKQDWLACSSGQDRSKVNV
jgi:hypothetical protein